MTAPARLEARPPEQPVSEQPVSEPARLLDSVSVARFAAHGFLRFDGVVPPALNEAGLEELRGATSPGPGSGARTRYGDGRTTLSQSLQQFPGIRQVFDLPVVAGAIESLLGPDPIFDHYALHVRYPGEPSQQLHADAIIDTRLGFDIQLMYFPQEVTAEMGGTLIVPGSHLRRVNEHDISRYQNLRGQLRYAGPAGSVVVLHHGIWHCGRRNRLDTPRYMFKLRLNVAGSQVRRWAAGDLEDEAVRREVVATLRASEPWQEWSTRRLDLVNRIALWRYLAGEPDFDFDRWYARLENAARPSLIERLPGASSGPSARSSREAGAGPG